MPISRDITSDESHPYQPRPSSSTFSVESFHNFPDTPITPVGPKSIRRTAPASPIIADPMPSSPMISSPRLSQDSTPSSVVASLSPSPEFIPLISARILPSFPHFYIHRPRVVNVSTDEPLPLSAYLWLASSSASAC